MTLTSRAAHTGDHGAGARRGGTVQGSAPCEHGGHGVEDGIGAVQLARGVTPKIRGAEAARLRPGALLGVDVQVILPPPCIFYMDNH